MKIYVGGSLQHVPRDAKLCRKFVSALGAEIVSKGHVLLNGCCSSLDRDIARAAHGWFVRNKHNPEKRIISYYLKHSEPAHNYCRPRVSALSDWKMTHYKLMVPEPFDKANATIFIAGSEGTLLATNWAYYARKPIFGLPRFGGAGETIYQEELERLKEKSPEVAEDYEALNQLTADIPSYAKEVVSFIERFVRPRRVFTIMSFKKKFNKVSDSCKDVCKQYGFHAIRIDESRSLERINPRIESGILESGFVIADVSVESANVYYELGFAKALDKDVIMIAKEGTKLPFDVDDMPILFWKTQKDLKTKLKDRIDRLLEE